MEKLNNIPIYWINLERSAKRKTYMFNSLSSNKYNYRISAIDGINLDSTNIILPEKYNETNYEIACTCSHLKTIYTAFISQEDIVLVSEDDIDFSVVPFWNSDLLSLIESAPRDWEILQLNTSSNEINKLYDDYKSKKILWSNWNNFSSTVIYAINRQGMEKVVKNCIKFSDNIIFDLSNQEQIVADLFIYNQAKTYTINKPIFNYFVDDSEIHSNHLQYQNKSRNFINSIYCKN